LPASRGPGRKGKNTGHEAAGTVVAVGEAVERPRVGDRVGISGVVGCGKCSYCLQGRQTYCRARVSYGSTHATMILAAAHGCHVLPDDIPWDAAVLLSGDGMGVPYHTSTRLADPGIRNVAIFAPGPSAWATP
jgi:threonine dehydrogenase-like Zn-dependent dehydrogenase